MYPSAYAAVVRRRTGCRNDFVSPRDLEALLRRAARVDFPQPQIYHSGAESVPVRNTIVEFPPMPAPGASPRRIGAAGFDPDACASDRCWTNSMILKP